MSKIPPNQAAMLNVFANRHRLPPVERLGLLRALIESPSIPPQVRASHVREAQQIELWAQMNLTPQQLHVANLHVEQAKHAWNERSVQGQHADFQLATEQKIEGGVREMTHGMLGQPNGISRAQLSAIRSGAEIPREHRPRKSQAAIDAQWRRMTRDIDPTGKGWSEQEAVRRLDALVDATPEKFAAEAKKFRGDLASIRREANNWNEQRIGYGLLKRRMEHDMKLGREAPDTQEPNERDRRRAAIVDAYLSTTADTLESDTRHGKVSDAFDSFAERVPEHLLNETHEGKPTRRAQLALAMAESDGDDEAVN